MHNNCNNRETVIIPRTIILPTKSIIVASLPTTFSNENQLLAYIILWSTQNVIYCVLEKMCKMCEEDALNSRMHVITISNDQEQLAHSKLIHLSQQLG